MPKWLHEKEKAVRDALNSAIEEALPAKKREKRDTSCCPAVVWDVKIADDEVVFHNENKWWSAPWNGDYYDPKIDLGKKVEVESKESFVPKADSKSDKGSLRQKANRILKKAGKDTLEPNEAIPDWVMTKMGKGNPGKSTSRQIKRNKLRRNTTAGAYQ